jgi:hypothetical protein
MLVFDKRERERVCSSVVNKRKRVFTRGDFCFVVRHNHLTILRLVSASSRGHFRERRRG